MFFGEEESPFHGLPPEVIVEVLSFVNLEGKKESRSVCRRWRWILDHSSSGLICFNLNYKMTTKHSIEGLLKSKVRIENLKRLHDIKMTWPIMTYSRNKFPPIQIISLCSGNCEQTVITILQYGCTQTQSLTLGGSCFNHVRTDILSRMLPGIKWNQLTELSLSVRAEISESMIRRFKWDNTRKKSEKNHAEGIEMILKEVTVPNLKSLTLNLFSSEEIDISIGVIKLISAFTTFIERHSKTLKELQFHISHHLINAEVRFPNIPKTIFSAEQQKSITGSLKLESLDIGASHFDTLVHLVPPFVWESDKLTKLSWTPLSIYSGGLMAPLGTPNHIQSLIQRNQNTLTTVSAAFIPGHIDVGPFQMSWLESCPFLRDLRINSFEFILNVHVQIPTVRKLNVSFIMVDHSIENKSNWIIRTFVNLEMVQILFCPTKRRNLEIDWVQSLLVLPRLREIRLRWSRQWFEMFELDDGKTLIRQFCHDKPRLVFTKERQREGNDDDPFDSCLIKVLPLPNNN